MRVRGFLSRRFRPPARALREQCFFGAAVLGRVQFLGCDVGFLVMILIG